MKNIDTEKRWYKKNWFMWLIMVIFFPIGLFLLWKYSSYKKSTKAIITIAIVGLIAISGSNPKNQTTNSSTTIQQTQTKPTDTEKKLDSAPKKEEVKVSQENKNALKKAEMYGNTMHMSKAGIYYQLTSDFGEKFSKEAAQYAINNAKIDYKKQALAKAKLYQEQQAMSKNAIFTQLTSDAGEKFTEEEAQYAINNLDK
jgi:hypothetical protein